METKERKRSQASVLLISKASKTSDLRLCAEKKRSCINDGTVANGLQPYGYFNGIQPIKKYQLFWSISKIYLLSGWNNPGDFQWDKWGQFVHFNNWGELTHLRFVGWTTKKNWSEKLISLHTEVSKVMGLPLNHPYWIVHEINQPSWEIILIGLLMK